MTKGEEEGTRAWFPSLHAIRKAHENAETQRPSADVRYLPGSKRNGVNSSKEQPMFLSQAEGHEERQREAAN